MQRYVQLQDCSFDRSPWCKRQLCFARGSVLSAGILLCVIIFTCLASTSISGVPQQRAVINARASLDNLSSFRSSFRSGFLLKGQNQPEKGAEYYRELHQNRTKNAQDKRQRRILKTGAGVSLLHAVASAASRFGRFATTLRVVDNVGFFCAINALTLGVVFWLRFAFFGPLKMRTTEAGMNEVMRVTQDLVADSFKKNFVSGMVMTLLSPCVAVPLMAVAIVVGSIIDLFIEVVPIAIAFTPAGIAIWRVAVAHTHHVPILKVLVGRSMIFFLVAVVASELSEANDSKHVP